MYGPTLRAIRRSRHLSQAELAEVSGIRQPNISVIENNRRVPSLETFYRLVVACGFELVAIAGQRMVALPLPRVGWFPDEDLPSPLADDPADGPPAITPNHTMAERLAVITAVLDASSP